MAGEPEPRAVRLLAGEHGEDPPFDRSEIRWHSVLTTSLVASVASRTARLLLKALRMRRFLPTAQGDRHA